MKKKIVYNGPRIISRTDDSFAKYLLSLKGHEDILLSVVNSVMRNKNMQEFKSVEVKNPFNLKEQFLEQETVMDVKAVTSSNETILLEMQVRESVVFFDRTVDYVMRNAKITENILLPKNKIKKEKLMQINPKQVISINFLSFLLYKDLELAHTTHMIHCCETGAVSSRKILIHMLELAKGIESIKDEELKYWFRFFYSENFEQEKEMIARRSPIMRKAVDVYNKFVSSDDCMSYAEKHQLYKMYQEWEKQATAEQALQEGLQQGAHEKAIETATKFLAMGLTVEQVAEGTGLSEQEILSIRNT